MIYKQFFCFILLLWSSKTSSQLVKKIHVRVVNRCPIDLSSWEKASRDLNCTPADRYQCNSNQNLTALVEYCYHQPPTFVSKGYCWILLDSNYVNTYNCSGFTDGCPNTTYRSEELYKYQKCLQLDKLKGCFRADKACIKQREFTTATSSVTDGGAHKIIITSVTIGIFIIFLVALALFLLRKRGLLTAWNRHTKYNEEGVPLLECPNLIIKRIIPRETDIEIEYSVTVSEECRAFTTLKWTKDSSELDLSDAAVKYDGGTVTDSYLRISNVTVDDYGYYQCQIQNIFGENTASFTLDEIRCSSKESQSILLSFLLLGGFCYRKGEEQWEEKLKLSSGFCSGEISENLMASALARLEKLDLDNFVERKGNEFKLHCSEDIFQSFMTRSHFVDFFLEHSHPFGISSYCRSPGYEKRQDEICCVLNPEQFKVLVKRLRFDILSHDWIDNETSHQIIEDELNIPKGILSLGREGVSKYLDDLRYGEHVVYCARGMLVGCQGTGKTSMLLRLKGEHAPNPISTRGLDVHINVFTIDQGRLEGTSYQNIPSLLSNFKNEDAKPYIQNAKDVENKGFVKEKNNGHKNLTTKKLQESSQLYTVHSANRHTEPFSDNVMTNKNQEDMESPTDPNIVKEEEKEECEDDADVEITEVGQLHFDETENVSEYDITVQTLSESCKDKNRKVISFFDFAGQFAYYASHHIYFAPNNFYILVMDITKKLNDVVSNDRNASDREGTSDTSDKIKGSVYNKWTYLDFTEYWLQSILSHTVGLSSEVNEDDARSAKKAPLILVATHGEGKTKEDADKYFRDLRDQLPMLSAHVDYANAFCTCFGGDLREIEECIKRVVQALPNWGKKIPMCWFYVENQIRKIKRRKIIQTRELLNICIARNIGIRSLDDIVTPLQYLHNIGVVLFFDEENLQDFVILDVQWFVDAFKHVITDDEHARLDIPHELYTDWKSFNETGLLTSSLLLSIWKRSKDCDLYISHKDEIMSFMIRLNLMTEVSIEPAKNSKQSKSWYCPCINRQTFPSEDFENLQNSSLFCFQFDYLQNDFCHRLLAACANLLRWKIVKMEHLCIYQTAALFDVNGTKVLIGMYSSNKIVIQLLDLAESTTVDYLTVRKHVTRVIDHLAGKSAHYKYTVGYMCKKTVFGKITEDPSHFIAESDMDRECIHCPKCGFKRKVVVKEIAWIETLSRNRQERQRKETQCDPPFSYKDKYPVTQISSITLTGVVDVVTISVMTPERLWVSDSYGRLIQVDSTGHVQIVLHKNRSIRTWLWDTGRHTVTGEGNLLFIHCDKVCKLTSDGTAITLLTTHEMALCIHYSTINGDILVGSRMKVTRYGRTGRELQVIEKDSNGHSLYEWPYYITENKNGDIWTSDGAKEAVVVVDKSGRHRFNYTGRQSSIYPSGICTDVLGHVLVCDYDSVHLLDQDGRFLSLLLTPKQHGICSPVALCVDDQHNLYMGQWDSNTINVYKYLSDMDVK